MDGSARKLADDLVVEAATHEDVPLIKSMVDAAYAKYIERLGKLPAAMTANHGALVDAGELYVLRTDGRVVGSVLLARADDSINLSNLVVAPAAQGRGYGRVLMDVADDMARSHGLAAVTLFTNEKMHENIALYRKLGFVETGRTTQDGFDRVFFRKDLP